MLNETRNSSPSGRGWPRGILSLERSTVWWAQLRGGSFLAPTGRLGGIELGEKSLGSHRTRKDKVERKSLG